MAGIGPAQRDRHGPHPPVRHLPAHLRDHHGRADQRRDRGPREVRRVAGVRAGVDAARIRSRRALGVGPRRLDLAVARRAGLRGRPRRRDRLRRLRSGAVPGPGPAARLQEGRDAPAQPADGDAGRGSALVRLVRLQRRFGARRQRPGRRARSSTPSSPAAPACSAGCSWSSKRDGHPTTLGAASGAVAGLVAITPSCGFGRPARRACVVGLAAGVGLLVRRRAGSSGFDYDDSLDVVGVHLVGGVVGTLLIGLFAIGLDDRRPGGTALRRRARPSSAGRRSPCSPSGRTRSS